MPEDTYRLPESSVLLRNVLASDQPALYAQQLDPEAVQMADFPARDWGAFEAHWGRVLADDRLIKQAILYGGQVVGNIVCFEDQGERLVGYWIGRGFWGLGIATAALAAFLRQIPARPLVARVVRHNVASRRVLEKCGFMLAGEDNDELILTLAAVMREGVVSSRCSGVATKLGLLRHHLRTQ